MRTVLALVLCLLAARLPGQLGIGRPFGDHMVLQRGKPAPIWGTAKAGESVQVRFGSWEQTVGVDRTGTWRTTLPALPAAKEPQAIELRTSQEALVVDDVLVGDVWLCSGQSNMEWSIAKTDAHDALAAADKLPLLRLFHCYRTVDLGGQEPWRKTRPETYFGGAWQPCSAKAAKDFSAVAFWFGRDLVEKLDVPIGLVMNAIGGSPTESWVPREVLAKDARFEPFVTKWPGACALNEWVRGIVSNGLAGWKAQEPPDRLAIPPHPFAPGFLYEAGLRWLAPCALRGVIWYQGESNVLDAAMGEHLFLALVAAWRREFQQGEIPFLWAQLSSHDPGSPEAAAGWGEYRDRQRRWLEVVPASGMAVTLDIGNEKDIHPKNKRDVGRRLALQAYTVAYGKQDIETSGPIFSALASEADALVVAFTHGKGLACTGGKVLDVEIAGADGRFVPALGTCVGERLHVRAEGVKEPRAVRYGFTPFSAGNLRNAAGLPASPFRAELPKR